MLTTGILTTARRHRPAVVAAVYLVGLFTTGIAFGIGAAWLFFGAFTLGTGMTVWAGARPSDSTERR